MFSPNMSLHAWLESSSTLKPHHRYFLTMKTNCTTLYPNEAVAQKVSDYAVGHSVSLPAELTLHYEWVLATQPKSFFTISPLEARFLMWLARTIGANRGMLVELKLEHLLLDF